MYIFGFTIFIILLYLPNGFTDFISLVSSRKSDFCITNSSSAMYYTTRTGRVISDASQFLPIHNIHCDFEEEGCIKKFSAEPWIMAYSINHEDPPLLDVRWENLKQEELPFKTGGALKFMTLLQLNDVTNFKIPLSLLGNEVHLLLCDDEVVGRANCYWFALQGWSLKYTALRRCKSGEIKGQYPRGDCYNRTIEKQHPEDLPLYIGNDKWNHVILERNENHLYLKTYIENKEVTVIHYFEEGEMFRLNYLLGHRKNEEVFCKVHHNHYLLSTTTSEVTFEEWFSRDVDYSYCFSIFFKTCPHCSTTIFLIAENGTILLEESIQPTNDVWKNHKIMLENSSNKFIRVKMKTMLTDVHATSERDYWSFDDIRECHIEEYRVTKGKGNKKVSECRLLASNQMVKIKQVEEYKPDENCGLSTIGNQCISCSILNQNDISCKNLKICDNIEDSNICYCSPGYKGTDCNQECSDGFYGYSCGNQCGFCQGKCDVFDGNCICHPLFEGPTCKMPREDHYLVDAPNVISSTAESCEIQWKTTNFVGKTEPEYYLLQYTDFSTKPVAWLDYGSVRKLENDDKAIIKNLEKNRRYGIRVLISDGITKIKKLHFTSLPVAICNTTCNVWDEKDVIAVPSSESVIINIQLTKDKCDFSYYTWKLESEVGELLIDNGTPSSKIPIKQLIPFTSYQIIFISPSNKINNDFKTLEGVPSEVRDIKMKESTASYMKINWNPPLYPRGDILMYTVKYQKVRRSSCKINPARSIPSETNVTDRSTILDGLEPFSEYKITISAWNRLNLGASAFIYSRTQGLNFFKEEEKLNQLTISTQTFERSISLTFQNIQCNNLLGVVNFTVKVQCISPWCLNNEERTENLLAFQGSMSLKDLQPYCEYEYDIMICRSETCIKYENGTVSTKATVPNELKELIVTAAGDAFIEIRWLPPYPPTGKQQIYRITTKCKSCGYEHKNIFNPMTNRCSIWPDYLCLKIKDYVYYNYVSSVEIEAANIENYSYKSIAYLPAIEVKETPPERPYNLSIAWNIDNTMEIFWNHPNRTNGILQYFVLHIETFHQKITLNHQPPKWKLTYNYPITKAFPSAVDIQIQIMAQNNKYLGEPAFIESSSFPASPELVNSNIHTTEYTENTISIYLNTTLVELEKSDVGEFLLLFIDDPRSSAKDPNLEKLEKKIDISIFPEPKLTIRLVAEQDLRKLPTSMFNFTIGDGKEMKKATFLKTKIINKPLQEAQYYDIIVLVLREYKNKYRYALYNTSSLTSGNSKLTPPPSPTSPEKKQTEESSVANGAYALLVLLFVIPIIIGIIMIKRKNIVLIRHSMSLEKIMDNSSPNHTQSKVDEETIPLDTKEIVVMQQKPVMRVKPKLSVRKSTNPPNKPDDLYSKPIKMTDFEEYVKTSIENGELEKQHALFPRGQTQPWEYGSTKVNKPKNRYNNLVAYDHSRVILKKIDGDAYSDYINANYIHGYNVERAYIATQGPKPTTLTDFWRMIWQENVKYVVMLANIYEGGKKKVEQYWPNINEELTFQDIVVQYQSMELFANFEYRIFLATKGNETREIEQLHFTTWPDHGVPLYPQSLVPFIRKLLKIPLSSISPVVVHCSAGVGRTGTILLADISLRMAAKRGQVDILNNLQKLREQRPNMVDNIEQYKLAHLVVLECLMGLRTSIQCDEEMDKNIQKLIVDGDYKVQMNYLKETEWQDQAMKSVADFNEELPNYPEKNRIQEIIPESQGRLFLSRYPHDDESSSYINAVPVDGFRCPGRFIVTQQPMPNTIGDFWRLVTERKINVIISLNEVVAGEKTCKFWPTSDEAELQPVDFILLKFHNVTELQYYDIISLHVWIKNKRQKEKFDVVIVAFKQWPVGSILPPSCEELLSFYEEADAISRRSTNVIVTCFDGVTASGVYVALSFIIEQMKLEHECDACLAVRTIRYNRKQFVTDEKQFLFLYECAVKFINGFQSYANFQNQ